MFEAPEIATVEAPKLTKAKQVERDRMIAWLDERVHASKKKRSAEVVTLTPVLASLLLERNPINRPISKTNSSALGSDIANGRFEFNGESIVVSNTGILLDGQHRCAQVVATGVSIETVIVFGPRDEARYTIDSGVSKTLANYLHMKGHTYTHALGPAINFFLQWREFGSIDIASKAVGRRPTKAAALAVIDEVPGLKTSAEFTAPCMKTIRSHAVLTFCHYVFWKKAGREAADHFVLKLIDGDGLRRGDPIHYCRNRLVGMGRHTPGPERIELIFKCWNAHRTGSEIQAFRSTGKLPKLER